MSKISLSHPLALGAEVTEDEVWTLPEGLIGVGDLRRVARVPLDKAPGFELLCSAEGSTFGLVLTNPELFVPDYTLALEAESLAPIQVQDPERLEIRVSVVVPSEDRPFALNLRGPLLFSPEERIVIQRVSNDENHPVRFVPEVAKSPGASCSS